jgi:polyisoprenyl-teichoic acid--peptidoglycan teichoic acid transferase
VIRRDPARRRGRRTWRERLLLWFSGGLAFALLLTAGGLAYVYTKYSRLPRVALGSVLTPPPSGDEAQNFLLVGVDSAANLSADDPARAGRGNVGGLRSDTVMILRVEPGSDRASLLSLPRDLWLPLASGGNQRINSAIQHGQGELIDTIEQYFGIPIHHYVQVDFAGFQDLVDVIGGVTVYFPTPARDSRSGLDIDAAGCITLDGQQALSYVRSRHYQRFEDGRWRTDGSADLGRISRQQDFIIRALQRAVHQGARSPLKLDQLVDAGLATVTVDDLLTADDIITLGRAFRSFNPDSLITYALPTRAGSAGGASILRLEDEEAQPILDHFRGTDTADLRPSDVRVLVLNGSGVTGHAGQTSAGLSAAGFGAAGTGEAERFDVTETIVRYTAGSEAKADLVARYLDPSARLELVDGRLDADVVVVTGSLLRGVRTEPRAASPSTMASTTTTTTVGTSSTGSSTTSPSTTPTTSTTVVGYVPQAPEGVDC